MYRRTARLCLLFFLGLWTHTPALATSLVNFSSKKTDFSEKHADVSFLYPVAGESTEAGGTAYQATYDCTLSDPVKVVVIGSSTAEGFGVDSVDSWVGRYAAYLKALHPDNEVINLAKGGYNTYHLMPSDPGKNNQGDTNRPAPDTQRNITKAISLNPDGIIINLPSNDANLNYGAEEQMNNFEAMYQAARQQGIPVWITTTQPRDKLNSAQNQIQLAVKEAIEDTYGVYALDFWTSITEYRHGEPKIISTLAMEDGIHLQPEGHKRLFEEVRDQLVYERITQRYTSVKSGNYHDARTWNLNTVPDAHAFVTIDDNHTVNLSQDIRPRSLALKKNSTLDLAAYELQLGCSGDMQGTLKATQATLSLSDTNHLSLRNLAEVKHLTIDKSAGAVSLSRNLTVTGTLQLTRGTLNLAGYDLVLLQPAVLRGDSAVGYIQTTGGGNLVYLLRKASLRQSLVFPVGDNAHYTPFTITIQSADVGDSARLLMSVADSPPVEAGTTDLLLSRQWHLRQEGLSNYRYDVRFQYLDEDVTKTADQGEENLRVIKYSRESGWLLGGSVDTCTNTLSAEGITSFSIFSGGNNIEGAGTLPVELWNFWVKVTAQEQARLGWETVAEQDNESFIIERSADATHWSAIGRVAGNGYSTTLRTYQFTDARPFFGHSYYRLKQVDFDGQYEYSPIVSLYRQSTTPFQVVIGPNPLPAHEPLMLQLTTEVTQLPAQLEVCDILGRCVYGKVWQPAATTSTLTITPHWPKGIYAVTVRQGARMVQQKLWIP